MTRTQHLTKRIYCWDCGARACAPAFAPEDVPDEDLRQQLREELRDELIAHRAEAAVWYALPEAMWGAGWQCLGKWLVVPSSYGGVVPSSAIRLCPQCAADATQIAARYALAGYQQDLRACGCGQHTLKSADE